MVQYATANPPGNYNTVAANQTTQKLSQTQGAGTGTTGDYLESITYIATTTTPQAVTVFDGVTAIISIPAGTATVLPYMVTLPVRAYSKTGSWNVTTGATGVFIVATGQFS